MELAGRSVANLYLRALSSQEPGQPKPVASVLAGTCSSFDCSIRFRGISQAGTTPGAKRLAGSGLGGLIATGLHLKPRFFPSVTANSWLTGPLFAHRRKEGGIFWEQSL